MFNVRRPATFQACAASLAALFLALSACSSEPPTPEQNATVPESAQQDSSGSHDARGAENKTPNSPEPDTITLAFAGDVHFERQVRGLLKQPDSQWQVKLPEMRNADFAMLNLETALGTAGRPAPKNFTFQAPGVALDKLGAAGVDAITMANNHAVDYGRAGLEDTLSIIAASPMPVVGLGNEASEAFAPHRVNIKGVNTAVLASSQVLEWTMDNWAASDSRAGIATDKDPQRLRAAVRAAAADSDLVVVFMHWGTEGGSCPNERQMERVRQLTEDGADIIVGAHAHRLQANGWHERAFVGYGLGNFIWYNTAAESRRSGVLTVTVDANAAKARGEHGTPSEQPLVTAFEWTPKRIAADGEPMSVTGAARQDVTAAMDRALACSDLADSPQATG